MRTSLLPSPPANTRKGHVGIVGGEDPAKTQLRREILEEELLSRFTAAEDVQGGVEVAAREEQIDKLCARSIRHGSDSAEERELQNRLDRLEKLTEKSLGLPQYELDTDVRRRCSTAPPTRCSDRGRFGHVARECVGRQLDPRNESPDCQSTVIKSVDEAVAGRLEKNSDVALEPVSDELEASVMQWQVEMLARDGYGGESGDEVSSSCETPQMPTPREKGSERDEVGEKPLEEQRQFLLLPLRCGSGAPACCNRRCFLRGPARRQLWSKNPPRLTAGRPGGHRGAQGAFPHRVRSPNPRSQR
ncbi:hypothetical protein HPB50_015085 [Hyalomma asiaticum]|uniref:Uncharacterized protein n=1 Tax=Hyalomma asiaticum TaxID=266040 RepID=A0ACB7T7D7_HYAAI|nr:hypothetical protein HPB50_015085 [Hyalomma asiaticum]